MDAPPDPMTATPRRSRRRKLLFAAGAWLFLAALLEGGIRVRERILYGTFARAGTTLYVPSTDAGHTLRANTEVSGTRMQVRVSTLGFRGHDVLVPKPAGTTRVVCVGGSTTFDILAASDDRTWPARLEAKLRAKHPSVEVVNAGVAGYTVDSFLAETSWKRIASLEPDVLVGYFATNEVSAEARNRFAVENAPTEPNLAARTLKAITDWSLFAYKVWLFVDSRAKPPELEGSHELPPEAARGFEAKLRELVRRARAAGARPALGTFALRWRADQPPETRRALAAGAFNIFVGLSLDGIDQAFRDYNQAIARVAKDTSSTLIPVNESLSGDAACFGDFVHFSDEGSERMADMVAKSLDPVLDRPR